LTVAEGRRSLEETWKLLRRGGFEIPAGRGSTPKLIDHHAGIDRKKDPVDITFFRSGYEGTDLSDLTLPRRYFNRSSFERCSFRNTDLNQSFMCWNDFIECDFTDADLSCCDMRATNFERCSFVRCKLVGANVHRSGFEGCDFTGAEVTGMLLDVDVEIDLTKKQWAEVDNSWDEGPEPKGG
jgi:uncharacterized protein YjbI with pentapeptide repeats